MDNTFSDIFFTTFLNKALIFTKKQRKVIQSPNTKRKRNRKLGTTTISIKEDAKYLGIILDENKYFSKHISLQKANTEFNKILPLSKWKYDTYQRN